MQYYSIGGVEADKQRRNFGCRCSIGQIDALQNTKKLKQANQKRIQRNRSTTKYKEIQQNQERLEDLAKKAQSEQSLKVILGSWKGMQDNFEELMTWKDKVEQQVVEITNVLNNMQGPKEIEPTKVDENRKRDQEATQKHIEPGIETQSYYTEEDEEEGCEGEMQTRKKMRRKVAKGDAEVKRFTAAENKIR
ncbi:protein DYAD-like [Pyrus ussuriensis x Pyrus communis]|uniref:Protein DYAD-like n=1 Tax=Pyrus ussuriensis x Pyrus communis TaxID=2448454 RepID=A0A5N5HIV4_9ROSA|nr:protein DYAD-like [Pyrus ussuriensis x Pyrus communis]